MIRSRLAAPAACAWLCLAAPLHLAAQTPQTPAPEPVPPPTPVEQALIEHVCSASRAPGGTEGDVRQSCLDNALLALRRDFGRDLSRLTAGQRKAIDGKCGELRELRGRDIYVQCLADELVALRNRRGRSNDTPSFASPQVPAAPGAADPSAPPAVPPSSGIPWMAAAAGALLAIGASGAYVLARNRRAAAPSHQPRPCRSCGAMVMEGGDLCQQCRHDAAEAKRAAASQEARDLAWKQEEERGQAARASAEALLLERQEESRREEEARARQQEALRREEEERARQASAIGDEAALDPHDVLGVAHDADAAQIQKAYEALRKKYDVDEVSHLGDEIQAFYRQKAEAIEQAYRQLTAAGGG